MSADWVDHRDVAAYALGLLGPRATADFEAHLSGCELCVAELAEFSRLAAVLPDVDVEALRTDAAGPDSRQLDRLLTRVAYTRRRAASVRLYAAAAAIVLFAGGLAGGLVIGSGHGSGSGTAVPREGYGTGAHPQPLTLQGSTAVQRTDIDHFEVRTVDAAIPSGGTTLVVLPMA